MSSRHPSSAEAITTISTITANTSNGRARRASCRIRPDRRGPAPYAPRGPGTVPVRRTPSARPNRLFQYTNR
ncbi:hypothetical protein GCM10010211_17010 [Streptomyces albospinus]|uniref:Uncharacterized protein n=1 Tax=Streptomyces albospinus TaxID=285515 RepID=A0ABQ2UXJ6_9ACTN|nr:hypothetical protein GCM10010211_17010 [Streptomyces albospinus]